MQVYRFCIRMLHLLVTSIVRQLLYNERSMSDGRFGTILCWANDLSFKICVFQVAKSPPEIHIS